MCHLYGLKGLVQGSIYRFISLQRGDIVKLYVHYVPNLCVVLRVGVGMIVRTLREWLLIPLTVHVLTLTKEHEILPSYKGYGWFFSKLKNVPKIKENVYEAY